MAKKVYQGEVVSDKMDKTVVVAITRTFQHSLYKRTVKKMTRFKAHDEGNVCKIGDKVTITETRPISRDKRWIVLSVNGRDVQDIKGEG